MNLITLDFLEKFKAFLNKEREERTKKLIAQGKHVPSNRSLSQGFEWADYSKEDAICVYIKYNQQVNGYDVSAICLVDTLYNEFYSTYNSATIKGHGFIHFKNDKCEYIVENPLFSDNNLSQNKPTFEKWDADRNRLYSF